MVLIVGWGIEDGYKFYIIQEDSGTRWGDKGYVKVISSPKGDGPLGIQR